MKQDKKPAKAKRKPASRQDLIIERIYADKPDPERMRRFLDLILSSDRKPKPPKS